MNKEKIEEVLKILKNKYDIILIDTTQDTRYKNINKLLIKLSDKIISFDIVEYNPLYDIDHKTKNIALTILNKIFNKKKR